MFITHYLRDANGNIMAVYNDSSLIEQPIYGSSRLGQYLGRTSTGNRTLGHKNYELTNHLGNVLTVVTDNISMSTIDTIRATVASASDYYPFGLQMPGRTVSDTVGYRYGFNGKERDPATEWGQTSYDYGFRIYNPQIGKFLSVDPLTKDYPWYTPYQFAGNTPIQAIDLDGLEELHYTSSLPKESTLFQIIDNSDVLREELITSISDPNKSDIHIYFAAVDNKLFGDGNEFGSTVNLHEIAQFNIKWDKNAEEIKEYNLKYGTNEIVNMPEEHKKVYKQYSEILKSVGFTSYQLDNEAKKGKQFFAVIIDKDYINNPVGASNTFAHEVEAHLKNDLKGIEINVYNEHLYFYGIDEDSRSRVPIAKKIFDAYVDAYGSEEKFKKQGGYIKKEHFRKGSSARFYSDLIDISYEKLTKDE